METERAQKTATFVKKAPWGTGDARVYRLDPPIEIHDWDDKKTGDAEYVAVSATYAMFSGPETYIFACDESGAVSDWGELEGSYRGGLDHVEALRRAGYEARDR